MPSVLLLGHCFCLQSSQEHLSLLLDPGEAHTAPCTCPQKPVKVYRLVPPLRLSRAVSSNSASATAFFHHAKLSGQLSNNIRKTALPIATKTCCIYVENANDPQHPFFVSAEGKNKRHCIQQNLSLDETKQLATSARYFRVFYLL